jgi:3-oxoisoapionate decarboxylase
VKSFLRILASHENLIVPSSLRRYSVTESIATSSKSLLLSRREFFLQSAALGVAASAFANGAAYAASAVGVPLGLDNFSLRAFGWKAPQLLEYAQSQKLDSLFISDLDAFESRDDKYLHSIRDKAKELGIGLHLGTWSICPTSNSFKNKWGSAEEHLRLGIRMAKALGSPVIRVILGNQRDRASSGGIRARIADTVAVCKACKKDAQDANVKIAVENHAGDMQARELVDLIEAAGKDYVGANIDSGNAVWAMEDPQDNLEVLAPYVLTSSIRDTAVWKTEKGAALQWTVMGEGDVDQKAYMEVFVKRCPGVPVHIETISGFNLDAPYRTTEFWPQWKEAKAESFARFLALAEKGKPREPWKAPQGVPRPDAEKEYQKAEFEKSIAYCRNVLGLGIRKV